HKGHLAPGADGDVVLYNPSDDVEAMFSTPVVVLKDGVVVAREGVIVAEPRGRTLRAVPPRSAAATTRGAVERTTRDRFPTTMTGFSTSAIGCGCPAGTEGPPPARTLDGRPGVRVLVFAPSAADLQEQLMRRVGQCVITVATTACFDDLPSEDTVRVGSLLRF